MSDESRPNPDELLAAIQRDEKQQRRGRLKVFFGMAPGVGKTFAMLEAARRELKSGRDLVVGYVETHGRKETNALTQGLPAIPRKEHEYRGVAITEMDLDALLARGLASRSWTSSPTPTRPARAIRNVIRTCWNCSTPASTSSPR